MSLHLVYSFFALFVLLAAVIHALSPARVRARAFHFPLTLLASLAVLFVPLNDAPVFYYLRGYIGDLSITTVLFFAAYLLQKRFVRNIYLADEARFLFLTVFCLGLFLYPLALGLGQFDPYRLGYHPHTLLVPMFLSALYFWHKGYYFLLLVVTSVVAGFSAGLLESNNLWDYLLDAVLWVVLIARYLLSGFKTLPKLLKR